MSVNEQPISGNGRTATEERIRNGYVRMETRQRIIIDL